MLSFVTALKESKRKEAIVHDAARLIEGEVRQKSGLSGLAIRAAFKAFQKVRPKITESALRKLLPHFAPVLDVHVQRGEERGDLTGYFLSHRDAIAHDLLGVTDKMAEKAKNRVMKRIYSGLRNTAQGHVAAAVPKLAGLATAHLRVAQ